MPYCGVALEDLASRFKEQCLAEEGLVSQVRDSRPALHALPACKACFACLLFAYTLLHAQTVYCACI